jgi:hypothetical protein
MDVDMLRQVNKTPFGETSRGRQLPSGSPNVSREIEGIAASPQRCVPLWRRKGAGATLRCQRALRVALGLPRRIATLRPATPRMNGNLGRVGITGQRSR